MGHTVPQTNLRLQGVEKPIILATKICQVNVITKLETPDLLDAVQFTLAVVRTGGLLSAPRYREELFR